MHAITLRFLAAPTDGAHIPGKVSGAAVLRWVDEAGFACATRWANGSCVTALVSGARFAHPIHIGDLVEVRARLVYTGTSSMGIVVEVYSGGISKGSLQQVMHCATVYVAVDSNDRPRPVDTWTPETPGDMALAQRVKAHVDAARKTL